MILKVLPLGPFEVNVCIVGSEATKEAFVVDPGADSERILKEVQELGVSVKLILNTHGHMDHTGVVATIRDATSAGYAVHAQDVATVKRGVERGRAMIPDFVEPPEPDRLLKDGDLIQAGELTFTILETPGHTPGSICISGHGVVFTGDTLFMGSIGRFDGPNASGPQLLDSIHTKLLVLPEETLVIPGHGPHTTIGNEKRRNPFLRPGVVPGFGLR